MGLIADYKLRCWHFLQDLLLAPWMLAKGKLHLFPERVRNRRQMRQIFRRSRTPRQERPMSIGLYPGCSLKGSSREYRESLLAVARALDMELPEVPDWNCCGATAAHNLNRDLALALPARILAAGREAGAWTRCWCPVPPVTAV